MKRVFLHHPHICCIPSFASSLAPHRHVASLVNHGWREIGTRGAIRSLFVDSPLLNGCWSLPLSHPFFGGLEGSLVKRNGYDNILLPRSFIFSSQTTCYFPTDDERMCW